MFQVRMVSRTWKFGTPIERPVPRASTPRCANTLAPKMLSRSNQMVEVSGAHSFSYLEEWSPIVLQDRKCTESVSSRKSHLRTVKILQNAFSHIMFLCPQRSDRAEKTETRNTRFSRQCALKTLLSGFGLKAFRKFTMKSA